MLQLHTVYKNTLTGKKERRGWKEGHRKITAGPPDQPKVLSSLSTCWLTPTMQILAKLLGIPGSSIIFSSRHMMEGVCKTFTSFHRQCLG